MIWFLLIIILIVLAFYLALRSMTGYQDIPKAKEYGLYLIRNFHSFNEAFLEKLVSLDEINSLERIYKGGNNALVWYCPKKWGEKFPEAMLLEIEDYAQKVPEGRVQSWEIGTKQGLGSRVQGIEKKYGFLNGLELGEEEQVYFQIVCNPLKGAFQTTLRAVVVAENSIKRADLAKELDRKMTEQSPLRRLNKKQTSLQIFKSFKERGIYPKEVKKQLLPKEELLALLRQ